ncbi:hypothetical protein D6853_11255 [Butyrivibrio sp. X503]|uniref:hypothetical protein n=1 Tax=Butyrivibrio sp. X503 TaxID=2364878 RepID=UPI000EAA3DF3|nr:hypothetical protein [Butyrivibrio sp. X503]RKM55288.1 hypothetical protein D6853_11255 [Butyrivibrio sp. X503]
MLGTLIKHEFKNTWMIMTLICSVTIAIGLVGGLFLRYLVASESLDADIGEFLLAFGILGLVMVLSALNMATVIYLVVHYYKSLYTSQGYLSFTLPASITEVVSSRMIVGCAWSALVSLSMGLCIFALVAIPGGLPYVKEFADELMSVSEDYNIASLAIQCGLTWILRSFASLMTFFFCISIGQLWSKHKILGAVLCYFATSFVLMIVSFSINYGNLFFSPESLAGYDGFSYLTDMLGKTLIYSLSLIAIFYGGSIFTSNKQLNLD